MPVGGLLRVGASSSFKTDKILMTDNILDVQGLAAGLDEARYPTMDVAVLNAIGRPDHHEMHMMLSFPVMQNMVLNTLGLLTTHA